MRPISFALLSAALVLSLPLAGHAQSGGGGQQPRVSGRQAALISLSGRYLASRVAEQDHDYDGGADQLDLALAQRPGDLELLYSTFRLRTYAGRIDAAAQLAPQVLAVRPGDGIANLVLAVQQIRRGEYRAAEQQLGRIGAENQFGPLRELVVAWLRAGQKDFVAARTALARLKTDNERAQAPIMVVEAQIEEMAGDKAAAETKYRRAVELDPSALRVVMTAADGLRRLGKADDARALLKAFGDKYSDSVVMDGVMAANAPAPKPPSPASGIAEILFDIGSALNGDARNQRSDLALIFEQFAVDLKPDHDFAWLTIASLYEQWGNSAKALAAYGKVGPASPLYWQARLRSAALDAQDERFDAAVSKLRALVAEKPDRIDAALTLADLLRSKERYADAVAAYDTAIQRIGTVGERHWPVFFGRGMVLERIKQWPRAEVDMKKALELSPEQPYVLNYLGYSWIDQGLNLDAGMKMLKRATELRPDDGAITDSVGWAYYRLGQFDKAVEWLERASEQKGDDATVVEHLGDAYWHVGRRREARFQWARAMNQKPDKDRIPVILDKVSNGLNSTNDKPTVYEKAADNKQGG
ncbi:tetratricopeptide repeat protein [Reyranella sp.]|uniref:tetratricopeptide repeat protein n=1 Tax=Reyranella sp. TaxID=1929291 RepID=UPI003D09D329